MNILIKNCRLTPKGKEFNILIEKGKISSIENCVTSLGNCASSNEKIIIDGSGLVAAPGFIDLHVHLRDPGFEYKEDVKSGTMAAAKGGFTTIFSMPNTSPVIDDAIKLNNYLKTIKKDAVIKVMPIAAVTKGLNGEELTDMFALARIGARAFSDDGKPINNDELFRQAMKNALDGDFLIFDHCEDLELSETLPIIRDINEAKGIGGRVHICHVSTTESIEVIRKAKADGVKVTCEATPHHFGLDDSIVTENFTDAKVNPPLRSKADKEAVINGIVDGTIDIIASDHAPHHKSEKGTDFKKAAFGISGIETSFSVSYTELVKKGYITFERLIELMSAKPAEIAGLDSGKLEVGKPADLVLLDLDKEITVDKEKFLSKGHNTPFHGRKYFGEVKMTVADGKIVYLKGEKNVY